MLSFQRESLLRQRPQYVTDHGAQVADWSLPTSDASIAGWSVQPGTSAEDRVNRDGALIQWTCFGPAGADVQADDRIVYDGKQYAIDGEPSAWKSPTGSLNHTVLYLKRWEG